MLPGGNKSSLISSNPIWVGGGGLPSNLLQINYMISFNVNPIEWRVVHHPEGQGVLTSFATHSTGWN